MSHRWESIAIFLASVIVCGCSYSKNDAKGETGATESATHSESAADQSGPLKVKGNIPPRLTVEKTSFDFKKMDQGVIGSHTFEIRNEGEGELLLRIQQTTCGCTSVKLGEVEWDPKHPAPKTIVTLDPGEKVDVELTWDTGERSGEFKTTANIESNDPKQHVIAFSVQGEIIPFVQLTQGQVRIDEVRNGTTTKAHTFVYSRKFDDLQLTDSSSSNPLITAKFEPVDDFFLQTMKAASGVKVEIIIQPGLPIGTFAASLTCRTNKEERPEVTIGISGQVQGAVLLTPSDNIDFKIVKTSESRTITLFVKIMGDEPVQVNVGNVRLARLDNTGNPQGTPVEEEVLKVDLQEMASSKNRWQLKVQVPQGSPGGKFKGVVEIETTHPTAKLVKIPVRFEVTK